MSNKDIELGRKAKDCITGFQGIVTGICKYISGCNQALLTPEIDKEGKHVSPLWFDMQRLERVGNKVIVLDNGKTPGCDMAAPIR